MAGSATVTGVQHYTLGIGHPKTSVDVTGGDDASPVVLDEGQTKAGPDGQVVGGGVSITGGEKLRLAIADLRGSVAAERRNARR